MKYGTSIVLLSLGGGSMGRSPMLPPSARRPCVTTSHTLSLSRGHCPSLSIGESLSCSRDMLSLQVCRCDRCGRGEQNDRAHGGPMHGTLRQAHGRCTCDPRATRLACSLARATGRHEARRARLCTLVRAGVQTMIKKDWEMFGQSGSGAPRCGRACITPFSLCEPDLRRALCGTCLTHLYRATPRSPGGWLQQQGGLLCCANHLR